MGICSARGTGGEINDKSPNLLVSGREAELTYLRQHVSFYERGVQEGVLDRQGPSDICLSPNSNFCMFVELQRIHGPKFSGFS